MGGNPGTPATRAARTFFSPDGFWWWDGSAWKPALSEDRLWRWNGQAWQPSGLPPARSSGAGPGAAVGIAVVFAFMAILVLVSIVVIVVLLTMSGQIANVFSNVAAALSSSPSP